MTSAVNVATHVITSNSVTKVCDGGSWLIANVVTDQSITVNKLA